MENEENEEKDKRKKWDKTGVSNPPLAEEVGTFKLTLKINIVLYSIEQ